MSVTVGSTMSGVGAALNPFPVQQPPPTPRTLSVSLAGTGSGTVAGSGISCPGICARTYTDGTTSSLQATAAPGSLFSGWGGACSGAGASCSVMLAADRSVTATFDLIPARRPPTLSRLAETYSTFAAGSSSTPLAAPVRHKRHHRGTVFSFHLDRPAVVTIAIQRKAAGRLLAHRCVAGTRARHHEPKCRRMIVIATLTRIGSSGANQVSFTGRLRGRALKPGSYRAIFTARNAAGAAPAQKLSFTIAPH